MVQLVRFSPTLAQSPFYVEAAERTASVSIRRWLRNSLLFRVVLWSLLSVLSAAQVPTASLFNGETATPLPGRHDYIHLAAETVNPSNGSVSINFQLPMPKGRGITLPFVFKYNSAGLYHVMENQNGVVTLVGNFAYSNAYPVATWSVSSFTPPSCQPGCGPMGPPPWGPCHVAGSFSFTDQNGVSHNLGLGVMANAIGANQTTYCPAVGATYPGQPNPGRAIPQDGNGDGQVWAKFQSTDSAGLTLTGVEELNGVVGPFTVTDKEGTTYFFGGSGMYNATAETYSERPYQIEDRNGNVISGNIDTLGRPMTGSNTFGGLVYPLPSCPSCPSATNVSYSVGYSATANSSVLRSGETMSCPPYVMQASGTQPAVNIQTLPTSTSSNPRQFTLYLGGYNPTDSTLANVYGLVNEIVYPDGGWVKYKWKMSNSDPNNSFAQFAQFTGNGMQNGSTDGNTYSGGCLLYYSTPVLASRTVSFDGVSAAQSQTFTYQTTMGTYGWNTKQTSVTTTDYASGNTFLTVYNYLPGGAGPSDPFATGTVAPGIPVESSILYYAGNSKSSTLLRTVTKNWTTMFDIGEEDTTENGLTRKTVYSYDTSHDGTNPFTTLTAQSEYDYGGTLLRTTNLQYQAFPSNTITVPINGTNYSYTLPVPEEPNVATVKDGTGNVIAENDYGYDGKSLAPVSAVQHDDSNYGSGLTSRGNLTSLTSWQSYISNQEMF